MVIPIYSSNFVFLYYCISVSLLPFSFPFFSSSLFSSSHLIFRTLRYILEKHWRKQEVLKHATRNMEYLIFGLLISPSIYACLIFSRCIHERFSLPPFFPFLFFIFPYVLSAIYVRNLFLLVTRRFLLFSSFLHLVLACLHLSWQQFFVRQRSFILPSSCLLDGRLLALILFRHFLKLCIAPFVDSNRFHSYTLCSIHFLTRCIFKHPRLHSFCHSYPFSYLILSSSLLFFFYFSLYNLFYFLL